MKKYTFPRLIALPALLAIALIFSGCGEEAVIAPKGATDIPQNVIATPGVNEATISWDAVADATSYTIYYDTATGVTKSSPNVVSAVTSPQAVTGLVSGSTYYFVVTATTASGESVESAEVSTTLYNTLGWPAEFPTAGSFSINYLLGYKIPVPADTNLVALGIISKSATGQVQIGIYADNGAGQPGALVGEIAPTNIVTGINEYYLGTPIPLATGDYWFMAVYDVTGSPATTSGGTYAYVSHTFGAALPDIIISPLSGTGVQANYYLIVQN